MEHYPLQVIGLFVRTPFFSHKEVSELCGEKENHVLKLVSKQKIKKLNEDPCNVLVWEEQDQTDRKKISEQTENILLLKRKKREENLIK